MLDRSVRPAATALSTYWDTVQLPDEQRPDIHFFMPDSRWHPDHKASPLRAKLVLPYQMATALSAKDVAKQMEAANSALLDQKSEPTLLFDACLHSGKTMERTKDVLQKNGFTNIQLGVATLHEDPRQRVQPEFVYATTLSKETTLRGCKPFGKYPGVIACKGSIYTTPETDPAKIAKAARLCDDIRSVIRKGLRQSDV
jgi:hypothetical protein